MKAAAKAIALLISAVCITGLAACETGTGSMPDKPVQSVARTDAGRDTEPITSAVSAENAGTDAMSAFQEAELIKVGEHTYYTDSLFLYESDNEDKDRVLSILEGSDKELHDDIFVYVIMQAETENEFRFSAKIIMDGVILEEGEMMNWYTPETGYVWDYDYLRFRRCDFTKSGIIPAEEVYTTVYEDAKANAQKLYKGSDIYGTYLLMADGQGELYYEFTVNKYSTVLVDAKTGSVT